MFELRYEPLSKTSENFGQIALVPWDTETFGFGVADFKSDAYGIGSQDAFSIRKNLEMWAREKEVEIVGTTVPSCERSKLNFLRSLGFNYVDTTLDVHYRNIGEMEFAYTKATLFPAELEDLETVLRICAKAFKNGRYHADPRIPRKLANRRYQDWARRTFASENPQVLLVAALGEQICAFSIVDVDGKLGRILLNAVEPQLQGQRIGIGLISATIRYLREKAADTVTSRISAANMAALNTHCSLGARFYDPSIILHWHSPWATHLEEPIGKD